jgi:hypothetical protein
MMEAREERFLNIDYLFFLYAHFRQFPGEVGDDWQTGRTAGGRPFNMKTLEQFLAARAIDLRLHFCEQLWRNIRNGTAILPLSICKPWIEYHIMETFQAVTLSELRTELTEFADSYKKDHPDTWKEDMRSAEERKYALLHVICTRNLLLYYS